MVKGDWARSIGRGPLGAVLTGSPACVEYDQCRASRAAKTTRFADGMSQGLELITWFSGGLNPIQEHGPSTRSSLHPPGTDPPRKKEGSPSPEINLRPPIAASLQAVFSTFEVHYMVMREHAKPGGTHHFSTCGWHMLFRGQIFKTTLNLPPPTWVPCPSQAVLTSKGTPSTHHACWLALQPSLLRLQSRRAPPKPHHLKSADGSRWQRTLPQMPRRSWYSNAAR